MKKIIYILLFSLLLFSCKGQENDNKQSLKPTNNMNTDTINLTPNISLFQVKNSLENPKRTSWELYIKNKKEDTSILLDSLSINMFPPDAIISSDNHILDIPKLLSGFIDNNNLYIFLFKERALWLYKYIFIERKFEYTRTKIFNMLPGSVPNFGDAYFTIIPYKINSENYFYILHNRVIGKTEMIARLDKSRFVLKKISFSESLKHIKDEQKVFRTLDLEQNKEKVSEEIKKILTKEHLLKQDEKFKYLGFLDDFSSYSSNKNNKRRSKGDIYLFYLLNNQIKIIRYNNYDNEWLIGDYKEEEIKQE